MPWEYDGVKERDVFLDGDEFCFMCRDGGDLMVCDAGGCKKVYHMACLKIETLPVGQWMCPYHFCQQCGIEVKDKSNYCALCPTSYCYKHLPTDLKDKHFDLDTDDFLCESCTTRELETKKGSVWIN